MTHDKIGLRHSKGKRRAARKAEDRKRAQRQRMLRWGGVTIVAAVALVIALIFINQDDDLPDAIAYDAMPSEGRYLGNSDAPVEFVIYSDFQCPFCKQFDDRDSPPLVENFVESSDVRVEWRPMPIISGIQDIPMDSPGNESVQAADAAMCAADQNQLWPYSDALYDAQDGENTGVYANEMLVRTANELKLDTGEFESCLASGEKHDEVMAHYEGAIQRGIMGTPTFLINDTPVNYSAEGYARLEQQLNDALTREMAGGQE